MQESSHFFKETPPPPWRRSFLDEVLALMIWFLDFQGNLTWEIDAAFPFGIQFEIVRKRVKICGGLGNISRQDLSLKACRLERYGEIDGTSSWFG